MQTVYYATVQVSMKGVGDILSALCWLQLMWQEPSAAEKTHNNISLTWPTSVSSGSAVVLNNIIMVFQMIIISLSKIKATARAILRYCTVVRAMWDSKYYPVTQMTVSCTTGPQVPDIVIVEYSHTSYSTCRGVPWYYMQAQWSDSDTTLVVLLE